MLLLIKYLISEQNGISTQIRILHQNKTKNKELRKKPEKFLSALLWFLSSLFSGNIDSEVLWRSRLNKCTVSNKPKQDRNLVWEKKSAHICLLDTQKYLQTVVLPPQHDIYFKVCCFSGSKHNFVVESKKKFCFVFSNWTA